MGIIYRLGAPNGQDYIGQTKKSKAKRLSMHKYSVTSGFNHCVLLGAAIAEFGIDNFEFEILMECPDHELDEKETLMIDQYNTCAPFGLNVMTGGVIGAEKSKFIRPGLDTIPVDFKADDLPKEIQKLDDAGYIVILEGRPDKTFRTASEFKNLLRALSYFRFCRSLKDDVQDLYISSYKKGFCVRAPGHAIRHFVSKVKTSDEKKTEARKYLNEIMFDEEKPELPGSIRTLRDGFRVKFPGAQDKHFVAANQRSAFKYAAAEKYLDDLRRNGIPEREFPKVKGLQKYRKGFRVKFPGEDPVRFESAKKTKDALYAEAVAYIESRNKS